MGLVMFTRVTLIAFCRQKAAYKGRHFRTLMAVNTKRWFTLGGSTRLGLVSILHPQKRKKVSSQETVSALLAFLGNPWKSAMCTACLTWHLLFVLIQIIAKLPVHTVLTENSQWRWLNNTATGSGWPGYVTQKWGNTLVMKM